MCTSIIVYNTLCKPRRRVFDFSANKLTYLRKSRKAEFLSAKVFILGVRCGIFFYCVMITIREEGFAIYKISSMTKMVRIDLFRPNNLITPLINPPSSLKCAGFHFLGGGGGTTQRLCESKVIPPLPRGGARPKQKVIPPTLCAPAPRPQK